MKALTLAAAVAALAAGPALAADMPVKAPPLALYNWSGVYVGGHLGWTWVEEERTQVTDSAVFPAGFRFCCDRTGFIGGGQAGVNFQRGIWVFGLEGDADVATARVQKHPASPLVAGVVLNSFADDKWYATTAGRVGIARDNWLFYAKGGVAWQNSDRGANLTGLPGGTQTVGTINATFGGWMTGAGIEVGLTRNWSAKFEYDFMDFGTHDLTFVTVSPAAVAGGTSVQAFDVQVHAVKAGFNYRFGDGPFFSR
jgi:outer membrane immunogenic protein